MEEPKKRTDAPSERKLARGRRANPAYFFLGLAGIVVLALLIVWWIDLGQHGPDLQRLVGRWQRTDGPYVLEVRQVGSDGKVDVLYFNPRPIKVASAQSTMEEDAPRLFVELQDEGYPGSTYTLSYDPATDELTGVYFQAFEKVTLDVAFTRK